ncbi:MAG: malto-oligosyltrehalose trehalohydrolase [Gammaproteobacteria bacterium]|nr:malto-oligosyltrehalose trehalohydrolase [Gammaproteobacteria bacterium]NIR30176.1 malto-oligosyltrehalose trehalohydrolase [Gammaproteobacteria bacterium]NIR98102.1 malto-oligosyltrehalose trehalohydrolase [Gammaproteobacteria bacterium]NIT63792.1 malto-oligosyltrehalose trehalohydrolase [Gammaproteobacteria bacterium]NIV20743.1 malto-oligosyltrehalose trehalohydrolase [Gammaproteobacteria bacterium]
MTRRRHTMPFGAEVEDDGSVHFRLWAPRAERVQLLLDVGGRQRDVTMHPGAEGWFAVRVEDAEAGSLYRFCIDDRHPPVPDPASRFQPRDVHGPSQVVDPEAWSWRDGAWRGRPWEECVFYELHVGTFSPQGTFRGVEERLDELVELGVSAIELMPVSDFPGQRNWGYDGVLPFAPDSRYGRPEELKSLVQAAHRRGLMVFLDVVYNHFGPEGNYLHLYAPQFFSHRHPTPWGDAVNFDGEHSHWVRQYFIENALYWLDEYHLDGLRLDAVHAVFDDSRPDILEELAARVRGRIPAERHVHLVLENDHNAAHYMDRGPDGRAKWYEAQWNDDVHHALHVLVTGETGGYYMDYAREPVRHLGRCLAEGFAYQGERSAYRDGRPRGEPSAHLPPTAFVGFLQNHDQVGNRAFGERITALAPPEAVRAATEVLLLAPAPPLLFMGQEWTASQPFLFFCDFGDDLAGKVTEGRRREFARFPEFSDRAARARIPDPNDTATFDRARLDRAERERPEGRAWLALHRELLALRRREIVPRLAGCPGGAAGYGVLGPSALRAHWTLGDGSVLTLLANLGPEAAPCPAPGAGRALYCSAAPVEEALGEGRLPPWGVAWFLHEAKAGGHV